MAIKQYFSHDVNALSDPKISIMIDDYGIASYAYWWSIIERLASTESNSLKLSKVNFRYFSKIWNEPVEFVAKFIQDLIQEYDLLDTEDGLECWSNSLNRRIDIAEEKRLKKVEAGRKGGLNKRGYRKNKDSNAINEIAEDSNAINEIAGDGFFLKNSKIAKNSKERKERKEEKKEKKEVNKETKENECDNQSEEQLFSSHSSKYSDEMKTVFRTYLDEIGEPSPITVEKLADLTNDFGAAQVIETIEYAAEKGKASISYISKVLDNKLREAVKQDAASKTSCKKYPRTDLSKFEG